jgi:hypothetical protein
MVAHLRRLYSLSRDKLKYHNKTIVVFAGVILEMAAVREAALLLTAWLLPLVHH